MGGRTQSKLSSAFIYTVIIILSQSKNRSEGTKYFKTNQHRTQTSAEEKVDHVGAFLLMLQIYTPC